MSLRILKAAYRSSKNIRVLAIVVAELKLCDYSSNNINMHFS